MKKSFTTKILIVAIAGLMAVNAWGQAFDPSVNIAEGKNAVSGWPMSGNEVPGKAVDNNLSTHWISWQSSADKAWWGIDLEAEYRLRSFTIVWENSGRSSSHFLIQVATGDVAPEDFVDNASYSSDGWTTIAEINETQSGEESGNSYDFDIVTGRYVRFVSLQNVAQTSIKEFRLYADELASKPEVTPVMGGAGVSSDLSEASATLTLTATDHNGDALHSFLLKDQAGKVFRVTTDGSDQATLTGLANKRYAFSVWAIEEGCLSASSSSVVIGENTFDPSTNLALNKPAYAVRYQGNTTNTPDKANDGSLTNFWNAGSDSGEGIAAADQDKVWWYVDLQDQYELKSLALFWEGAYANSFIMQVRKDAPTLAQAGDDSAWETFLDYSGSQSAGTSKDDINLYGDITDSKSAFSITPKGRYVRFRAKAAQNWGWGVKLREVRIYGSGYLALDNTAPIISEASYNGVTADYLGVKFNVAATDDQTDPVTEYVVVDQNSVSHNVTVDESIITITDMPSGKNVDVTIYALDAAGNRSLGEVVNISYLRPDENIALDKDAYACVNIGAGEGPAKAVDGSTTSDWTSWNYAHHDNAWWYVDLGDFYDIRRIEVVWTNERHSSNFSIQYRQNAPAVDGATESEWHNFPNCTDLSGDQEITVTNTQARYICMRSKVNYSNNQVRLAEFRVFGKAFATPDNDAPLISSASYNGTTVDYTGLKFNITVSDNVTAVEDIVFKVEDPEGVEHEATYDEGVITVTGMPTFKNEDITLYAYDAVPNKSTGYIVENVSYVDPTENLAYHKDAYACVHINDGEGKLMPVDGNTATTWTSYSHGNHANDWWYVDLGEFYDIRRIEVVWQTDRHSTDFSIQYRQNAPEVDGATESEWNDITEFSGKSGDQAIDITNTQARYLCMRSKDYYDHTNVQVRMAELRVFGKSFAEKDLTAPTITTADVADDSENVTSVKLHIVAEDNKDASVKNFLLNKGDEVWVPFVTDGSDYYTVSDLERGHYSYQVKAIDKAENISAISTINFDIFNPADNLALTTADKVVAGYTPGDANEVPSKVNDGKLNSAWTTWNDQTIDKQWWSVDLGDVYQLSNIDLFWGEAYSNHYLIQVAHAEPADRSDDTQWYTAIEVNETQTTGNTEENKNRSALNISARYVRFKAVTKESSFLRLYELRLFGSGFAAADTNVPVISTASVSYNNDGKAYITLIASDSEDGAIKLFRVVNTTTGTAQLLTTNGSNQLVFDDLDLVTTYHFEIQAMDKAANLSATSELDVYIPTPSTTNIAPRGTATAGYTHEENEAPEKAIDENSSTSWTTYNCSEAANRWWQVELDGVYHLSKIAILWNDDWFASKYTIKTRVSTSDEWTVQPQVSIDEKGLKEMSVDLNAKFVRIEIDEQNSGGFIRMHEVQICGELQTITLNETSNAAIIEAYNNQTMDVTIGRSILADNTWYTLCLPFDMDADKVNEVFGASTIAQLTGSEDRGSLIHLNFDYADAIEAGRAYLIMPGQNFVSGSTISGVTIENVDPEALKSSCDHMYFQGTFNKITLNNENQRFVGENNYLYSPNSVNGSPVGAFRCFFTIRNDAPAGAPGKRACIVFSPQHTTDIDNISEHVAPAKFMLDGVLYIIRDGRTYNAQGMLVE